MSTLFPHGFGFRNPWEGAGATTHPSRDNQGEGGGGVYQPTPQTIGSDQPPIQQIDGNDIECRTMLSHDPPHCEGMEVVAVATPVYDDNLADIPPVIASPHSPEQLIMRQRNHCVGHLLRTMGWMCILLSVCEVGVGGAIYSFFDNVHFGTFHARSFHARTFQAVCDLNRRTMSRCTDCPTTRMYKMNAWLHAAVKGCTEV